MSVEPISHPALVAGRVRASGPLGRSGSALMRSIFGMSAGGWARSRGVKNEMEWEWRNGALGQVIGYAVNTRLCGFNMEGETHL